MKGARNMSKKLYYCFSTLNNKYMYVRNINSIVRISEAEYEELKEIEKKGIEGSPVINKYIKLGVFIDNPVKINRTSINRYVRISGELYVSTSYVTSYTTV